MEYEQAYGENETPIKKVDIAIFILLLFVTCGLYIFYVSYVWAKNVNYFLKREKYNPILVLLVGIATCGIATFIFEILFAYDLQAITKERNLLDRLNNLGAWAIGLNILAIVLVPLTKGFSSFGIGIIPSVLIQLEINKLIDQGA